MNHPWMILHQTLELHADGKSKIAVTAQLSIKWRTLEVLRPQTLFSIIVLRFEFFAFSKMRVLIMVNWLQSHFLIYGIWKSGLNIIYSEAIWQLKFLFEGIFLMMDLCQIFLITCISLILDGRIDITYSLTCDPTLSKFLWPQLFFY